MAGKSTNIILYIHLEVHSSQKISPRRVFETQSDSQKR